MRGKLTDRRVLGVDPGLGGGLALLDQGLGLLMIQDYPTVTVGKTRVVNTSLMAQLIASWDPDIAWIERVHAMPKQGVVSTFNFGMTYGMTQGVLAGLRVPVQLVTPQEWKREFRLGPDKQEARVVAARMFPGNVSDFARRRDDGRAEAALIALFGAGQTFTF